MDKLAAMQVFVRVVEAGGLSAAGRQLGLAPPSVSRRISELEALLGVRLLQRTTRKLSLTEQGEAYYERARDIVQAVDEANLAATEKRAAPAGTLRVSMAASMAKLHIIAAIADFHRRHPNVRVVLRVSDRVVDFIEESLDVALRIGRLEDSSLIAKKLGQCNRIVCASPAYLKRAGRPKHPADLSDHACLSYRAHASVSLWRFRRGKKTFAVRTTGPFFSDEGETLVAGACAGLGIILVPEWLAGIDISGGRLEELLPSYKADPATTPLYALSAPGPYVAPKIRAFVDFLSARFSKNYDWRSGSLSSPETESQPG